MIQLFGYAPTPPRGKSRWRAQPFARQSASATAMDRLYICVPGTRWIATNLAS